MNNDNRDYMKYWKVVRAYILQKYELTTPDLDLLLYLYSEGKFKRKDFDRIGKLVSFTAGSIAAMKKKGLIVTYRSPYKGYNTVFDLSRKGKLAVNKLYNLLEGKEIMSMSPTLNKYMKKDASGSDKKMQDLMLHMMEEMRKAKKRELRPFQKSPSSSRPQQS